MNLVDLLLTAIIALAVFLAARHIVRSKKSGKSCCCGNCSSCKGCK